MPAAWSAHRELGDEGAVAQGHHLHGVDVRVEPQHEVGHHVVGERSGWHVTGQ